MKFTTITEEQFKTWVEEVLKSPEYLLPVRGRELVIRQIDFANNFELHIYTSLDGGESRGIGEDAIRCVLFDKISMSLIGSTKRVNRTEGATTIWQRLNERLAELMYLGHQVVKCKKCGAHCIERKNGKTGSSFMGCSAFPKCGGNGELRRTYPLVEDYGGKTRCLEIDAESRKAKTDGLASEAPEDRRFSGLNPDDLQPNFITNLVEENELISTKEYTYPSYPFEYFNRVQSTILQNKFQEQDVNLVLGTTTSSGKTIAAELFMGYTLKKEGKKILYVSPLKSLTQEKYEAWQKTFSEYKICIMTGDYDTLSKDKIKELNSSDIIVMTAEMLDSRSRNTKDEKSDWMHEVGLIILDESHILSTTRGHAVEVGIMRFTKICPQARILFLSATMPNVEDFRIWLTKLNGKKTEIINSSWRPTVLDWHFIEYNTYNRYKEQQDEKMAIAVNLVKANRDEKFLIFVHDKNSGRQLERILKAQGIETFFHNADLEMKDRLEIERSFEDRKDGIRVLVSSSTLAWGRNIPGRNVIICGVTRGMNEVDELDILQMAGRSGRFGLDPKGDCYLICDDERKWRHIINNPRKVISTLIDEGVLGFHILAEIKVGGVYDKVTLKNWFDRSLARIQNKVDDKLVDDVLARLIKMNMIEPEGRYKTTWLGDISVKLYYHPTDIFHWYVNFSKINTANAWDSDLVISWALGSTPSFQLGYVPRDAVDRVNNYMHHLKTTKCFNGNTFQSVIASDLYDLLTGNDKRYFVKGIQFDIDRILNAVKMMNGTKRWGQDGFFKALGLRIKYGIGKELIELCQLPGIGAIRAKKLYDAGIKRMSDVENVRLSKLSTIIGKELANDVKREVELIANRRQF